MTNLIKVVNQESADKLISLGFTYTKEYLEDKTIYVFMITDKLMKVVQSNFSKKDYFVDNRICFV